MDEILKLIKDQAVDYPAVFSHLGITKVDRRKHCAYHVIIPVRGREEFIKPLLASLELAAWGKSVAITIVEHSEAPGHYEFVKNEDVNYIWMESHGPFNKCLAFNVGVILGPRSIYVVCHDLDMLVQPDFFDGLSMNMYNKASGVVQSFNNRRVIYCNKELTDDIISKDVFAEDLHENYPGTFTWPGEAPGGSITMQRDIFFEIGGYDPELFHGYAPEDSFMWDKISTLHTIGSCDNPVVEVFHMHHEPTMNSNPDFPAMRAIALKFNSLKAEERMQIIQYKRNLISQYK